MADLNLRVSLTALDQATAPMRRAMGAARGMAAGMSQAQKSLAALNRQQRDIAAYRQNLSETKKLRTEWQAARQRVQQLTAAQAAAGEVTRGSAAQMRQATAAADRAKNAWLKKGNAARDMGAKLRKAGIETSNLASHEQRIKASIDRTTAAIERQTKARAQAAKMAKTGAAMSAAGAASLVAGRELGRKTLSALDTGRDFENTMSRVQALSRLSKDSEELKALRAQARQLGADTMFSAPEAAQGQAFLAMAGFTPQAIQAAMPGLLDMAKAGDTELGRTADIASNILSGFGIDPGRMSNVADVLTKTFTTSNTNLEMLGDTMGYVAPVARAAGVDLETTAAMAGLLGNVGIQGSKGGTALRAMLLRLSAPTGRAAKAMDRLKVKSADAQGNMRNVGDILADIAAKTEKMGNAQRMAYLKDIFGEEPAAAMAELIDKAGSGGITEYLASIRDSQGAAAQTAKTMADNWTGAMDEMSSAWDDVKIGLFDTNSDTIRELTDTVTAGIRRLGQFVNDNPLLVKTLFWAAAGTAVFMMAMGALLIPLGLLVAKGALVRLAMGQLAFILPKLGALASGLGSSLWGMASMAGRAFMMLGRASLAFLATPMGVALALLAGAAYLVWRNWDGIKGGAVQLWQDITAAFNTGIEWLASLPQRMIQIGADMIGGLIRGITGKLADLRGAITSVADSAANWFKGKLGISSPSRVFMQYGGWVSEGAALGIARKAPLVSRAAAAMAALPGLAAAPALAASVAAVPAVGRPAAAPAAPAAYHITINAAPGQDPQAIARAVAAELDRRERQRAARGFSMLTDR